MTWKTTSYKEKHTRRVDSEEPHDLHNKEDRNKLVAAFGIFLLFSFILVVKI